MEILPVYGGIAEVQAGRNANMSRARRAHGESGGGGTKSIPDIPDGYVITGGELFSSVYDMATRGFGNVNVTAHGGSGAYCNQHSWYDMRADWTRDDASDRMTIDICVHYVKWSGTLPTKPCLPPVSN